MQPSEAQQAKAAALVPEKHRRAARAAIATALAEEAARVRRECWARARVIEARHWRLGYGADPALAQREYAAASACDEVSAAIAASGPMAEPEGSA